MWILRYCLDDLHPDKYSQAEPGNEKSTSTVLLASGFKETYSRHQSPNVLFAGCVSAAIAHSAFPDNARIVKQVSAMDLVD
ncbi:hypothetical protein [Microcoleus sp. bin38.metabat.b11b12b14.051]|uniref:hypothetical protein n=1 Tax=Microcoleus sp. bin38.metabat.b11b12b14.051 TaxID=2742709 RepID=UPI0025FE6DB2|nr:hypothetical protein [Microcoleus sp. bin38.metabat.b11b12b14.051]